MFTVVRNNGLGSVKEEIDDVGMQISRSEKRAKR